MYVAVEDAIAEGVKVVGRRTNGQVAEVWHIFDVLSMLQQLGVIPTPG